MTSETPSDAIERRAVAPATGWMRPWSVWVLYLWLGFLLAVVSFNVRRLDVYLAASLQETIWNSLAKPGAANRTDSLVLKANLTRVFMPGLMVLLVGLTGSSWPMAFSILRLATAVMTPAVVHWTLRAWFSPPVAVVGTLLVVASLPLTYNNFYEVPTDFPELIAFMAAMRLIYRGAITPLVVLVFLATLNRETAAFIPLLVFLVRFDRSHVARWLMEVMVVGLAWLVPLATLRWWTGVGALGKYGDSIAHNAAGLTALLSHPHPYNNYLFYLYVFGPLWIAPFLAWGRQPTFFRRALVSIPVFLGVYCFLGGFLDEPREIVNMYAILLPPSLLAFGASLEGRSVASSSNA